MSSTASWDNDDGRLDPLRCRTFDDVAQFLCDLRAAAGLTSFREITSRVNARRREQRVTKNAAASTVHECFKTGRKRMDRDLVLDVAYVLGLDRSGLARLEQACLIAGERAEEAARADVRDRLPAGGAVFVGRGEAMRQAAEAVRAAAAAQRPAVVAVTGPAGIGKTEFAVQFARRAVDRGYCKDVHLFADLHGFDVGMPPADPHAVLAGFLKLLGLSRDEVSMLDTEAKKRDRFHRELSGKQALLVLDNVRDAEQVAPLLPGDPGHLVLVASRDRLDGNWAARVELEPLGVAEGVELLRRMDPCARAAAEPDTAARVAGRVCYGMPFDLVTLGGQLNADRDAQWSLADHEARLRRLGADETIRPTLASSYQSLPAASQRVFRLLAAIPSREFTAHEAAVLADLALSEAEAAVLGLYSRHLVGQPEPRRFRFHDTMWAYAGWLLDREEPRSSVEAALKRLREADTRQLTG